MKTESAAETEPRHPIGVVSGRTGIPQDVLRAWERRYEAVIPHRTGTGRRLYSDHDLRKLRLLKVSVDSGRRISDVAAMSLAELERLAEEDRLETADVPGGRAPGRRQKLGPGAAALVAEGLEAVESLDGEALRRVLSQASVTMTPAALRRDLIVPLMRETGRRWRGGSLRIAHEHLATAIVRSFLGALPPGPAADESGPTIVIATPVGNDHELGALLAAACAAEVGWIPVYLGPNLPAEELAAAVQARGARAVALSLAYPASAPTVHAELRKLRELLAPHVEILVGGDAAAHYDETLRETGARRVDDLQEFQSALEAVGARNGRHDK